MHRRAIIAFVALALACVMPSVALAAAPPHVATSMDTDTCAMCHRAHSGNASFGRIAPDSWEMTSNALAIVPGTWEVTPEGGLAIPTDAGDTPLCYVCHGVDALGSGIEVQSSFENTSAHTLAPVASPYGPSVKYCSTCHDSHGADKTATDDPYPALLRSRTETGTGIFSGEEYCATCHPDRPMDRYDGLEVYRATGHYTELPDPAVGTGIRCLNCHVGHGSPIAPLLTSAIATPAVETPVQVAANDRTLCFACHQDAAGVYLGATLYAPSSHATSEETVAVTGEWPEHGASRLVGECQVCHAPMGRADAEGNLIPKLADAAGAELCLRCHDADGPAESELATEAAPPAALELLAAYAPATPTAHLGVLQLFAPQAGATPRTLNAAREYRTADGGVGAVTIGDLDGDGTANVLVLDPNGARVTVFSPDPLKGLSAAFEPGILDVPNGVIAEYAVITDVFAGAPAELVLVDADAGQLYVYRYDDTLAAELQLIDGPVAVGTAPSGIAAGQLSGGASSEIIVTDSATGRYYVLTESATPGVLTATAVDTGNAGITGPSIGDVLPDAGIEVAIANAGEDPTVAGASVYSATGTLLDDIACTTAEAAAAAVATLIADVISTEAGAELVVAIDAGAGESSVNVFAQGATLTLAADLPTGAGYRTSSLAAGDLDGAAGAELVVGNAGAWDTDGTLATAPSVQVFTYDAPGEEFVTEDLPRWAGGVEYAGAPPALAVVDLGGITRSSHPVDAVDVTHVSTETAGFDRHVTCADCHDSHQASDTPALADADAPSVYGVLRGAFGATLAHADATPVEHEYEVCLKCHSAYGDLDGSRDIGADIDPANASVHAIIETGSATAPDGTFENGWTSASILYCADCHGSAEAVTTGVDGPHASSAAPLLKRPFAGISPRDEDAASTLLCYTCHKENVYLTGTDDAGASASLFGDTAADLRLHSSHALTQGFSCAACHVSHGSATELHLLRSELGFTAAVDGGSCVAECHDDYPTPRIYTR